MAIIDLGDHLIISNELSIQKIDRKNNKDQSHIYNLHISTPVLELEISFADEQSRDTVYKQIKVAAIANESYSCNISECYDVEYA